MTTDVTSQADSKQLVHFGK